MFFQILALLLSMFRLRKQRRLCGDITIPIIKKPILEQKLAIGRFGCRGVAMLLIAFAGLNVQTLYSMKAAKWEGAQGTIGGLRSLCDLTADTVSIIATWKREVAP